MKLPKGFSLAGPDFYKFQYKAFLFCIERDNAGLLLDLGLGKTRTAIDVARYRIQFSNVNRILVVCPTSVMGHWEREVKFWSEHEPIILQGDKEERLARLKLTKPKFKIINYEYLYPMLQHLDIIEEVKSEDKEFNQLKQALRHHKYRGTLTEQLKMELTIRLRTAEKKIKIEKRITPDGYLKIKKLGFDMIIFDESARYLKTHNTNRTIAATLLADRSRHKLIMTATPIANKPLDLFAQLRVMDGGKTFGQNFFRFRNGFFENVGSDRFKKWKPKAEKIPVMAKRLYTNCIRMMKSQVFKDLPDIIPTTILLEPSESFLADYKEIESKILAEIETEDKSGAILNITNVLTKLLRLQQLTSGFVKDKVTDKEKKTLMTPKLDALIEQIEIILDAEESCVVWCRFHKTMDMISEILTKKRIAHYSMSGRDSSKQKDAKWIGFQKSKTKNVFIGQVASGGIGIELFKEDSVPEKSQYMIFFENVWSLDIRQQAEGRIHRIGQKSTCVYIDIIMNKTIDVRILQVLRENKEIADFILDYGIEKFIKPLETNQKTIDFLKGE